MLGSVEQRGWDSSLAMAWGLALVALLAAGCSDELEVTTEYLDDEALQLLPPGTVIGPAAPVAVPPPDGEAEATPGAEQAPEGPAADGSAPQGEPAPTGDGLELPLPLAAVEQVPSSEHCARVADWDPLWVQFEEEVLLLVNEAREQPADCGEEGVFPAVGPVSMDPVLRCSARLHSVDMFERHFFNHVNPDGRDPFERMGAAGFRGSGAAENIAVGQTSPAQVMQSWMDSDGHCSNVMRRSYALLGVGYHPGVGKRGLSSNYWTQNFGAPPRSCTRNCR